MEGRFEAGSILGGDDEMNPASSRTYPLVRQPVNVVSGLARMVACRRSHAVGLLVLATGAVGWNGAVPRIASNPSSSARSVTSAINTTPRTNPWAMRERHRGRLRAFPGDYRLASRDAFSLANSGSDTMEQEPVPGNDGSTADYASPEPRPFPKVGDVVRYKGKWENDVSFGEVRQLQRVDQTGEWRAYVLGLEDIGDGQYARKKNRKSKAEDVTTLKPVRAFYVRSVDGFKVMLSSETGEPRYISDAYELEGFALPKIVVDPVKFAADLETYEDLKRRLVLDTATFGAVGAFVAVQIFGADLGLLVALGALASVGYVILLEKTADDVASGKQDAVTKVKGDARFAIPVLLVAALALKNFWLHPEDAKLLNLVPKEDFAAVMLGFIAPSRLPLLYREIRSSLKGEELLDMLPGSVGQGRQILKSMGDPGGAEAATAGSTAPTATRVVVMSGPKYLGKTTLANKILAEDNRLAMPAWCTTRPLRESEVDGKDVTFLRQVKFVEMERNGSFLCTYQDESGESYGLRLQDILAVAEQGKVCVVDADTALVKALMGVGDLALIGVWVSLDSIEAIKDRIRTTLAADGVARDAPDLESEVRGLVRQAVADIEFGVTSGVFDFTVINNSDVGESMETVRRAVEFATA